MSQTTGNDELDSPQKPSMPLQPNLQMSVKSLENDKELTKIETKVE